ncbi:nuclear transport factor 2 family protein [Colwellia sp. MB02u-14]|uniref:YybH family protein n=1 Tax=Colwellia sp. MB02u-14 TaxID=2759815 RepID=UPI0028707A34|nr:nuclear transport factor 2 family protein [Colwellia sp. MB02u-14]
MNGDIDKLMAIYTPNAHVISGDKKITSDNLAIKKYWTPNKESQWQLISYTVISEELIIEGNMASDIGYYTGDSQYQEGRKREFSGAYVIVWRKIDGVWLIHLDMWNSSK